jgi:hypothetical protein
MDWLPKSDGTVCTEGVSTSTRDDVLVDSDGSISGGGGARAYETVLT